MPDFAEIEFQVNAPNLFVAFDNRLAKRHAAFREPVSLKGRSQGKQVRWLALGGIGAEELAVSIINSSTEYVSFRFQRGQRINRRLGILELNRRGAVLANNPCENFQIGQHAPAIIANVVDDELQRG